MTDQLSQSDIQNSPSSKGEKLFNALNYWGIGWIANVAVSVAATWALKDSKFFKPKFESFALKMAKGNAANAKKVESTLTNVGLSSGGFILLAPMKAVEDHKLDIVKNFDGPDGEQNPQVKAAHERIAQEPKQGWFSLVLSRVSAVALVLGVAHLTAAPLARASASAARKLDKTLTSGGSKEAIEAIEKAAAHSPGEIKATERVQTKLFNYTAMDVIFGLIAASSLFVFTRLLGGLFDHKKPPLQTKPDAVAPMAAAPAAMAAEPARDVPQTSIRNAELQGMAAQPAGPQLTPA